MANEPMKIAIDYKESAEILKKYLGMNGSPVAFRFATSKDDIPKRDNQVAAGGGNIMEGLAGFVSPGRQINK